MSVASQIKCISEEEARRDFCRLATATEITSRAGLKAVDAFTFPLRLETRTSEGVNFVEWCSEDRLAKPYVHKLVQYGLKSKSLVKAQYDAFQLYSGSGSLSSFPPIIAKKLFEHYKPTRVCDPCAGWGGRALAAISVGCEYVGLDTNSQLVDALRRMADTFGKATFKVADSAKTDYATVGAYDMVFTSPPYFTKSRATEIYAEMPAYKSRADFNENFLIPMVKASWKGMSPGIFALNIPAAMLSVVETVLGKHVEEFPMKISRRKSTIEYKEMIYVWRKIACPDCVELRPSLVHGVGVFARDELMANISLGPFVGEKMTKKEFTERFGSEIAYTYWTRQNLPTSRVIVAKTTRNWITFINESLNPNVNLLRGFAVTTRPVAVGEELFLRYAPAYKRDYSLAATKGDHPLGH